MEPIPLKTEDETQTPDAYVWEVPGKPVRVEIDFAVVDRLEAEVLDGFGALPRRGLEIGGILLGSAGAGDGLTAKIEDFEPVPSKHENGPSYVISGEYRERFEEALERWQPQPGRRMCAVGFYRSHTREDLSLSREDLELLSTYFPDGPGIALVIKPFATRAPLAGFFFREEGTIRSESSYHEFPFRRRELGGGDAEAQLPYEKLASEAGNADAETLAEDPVAGTILGLSSSTPPGGEHLDSNGEPDKRQPSARTRSLRLRGGWVWVPLSFIFLLLGTVLGFQVALSVRSQITSTPRQDPYALSLTASASADSVHLRWDRQSPAIRKAQRGVLVISENGTEKRVDLDVGHLRNGSVIYRRASEDVGFRLEVFTKENVSVSETIQFQSEPAGGDSYGGE